MTIGNFIPHSDIENVFFELFLLVLDESKSWDMISILAQLLSKRIIPGLHSFVWKDSILTVRFKENPQFEGPFRTGRVTQNSTG